MQQKIVLHISGVPIFIRHLPSGDMAVWHPYNEAIRAVIEPICRENGYWQPLYNNWIILKSFKEQVLESLQQVGGF